MSPLGERPPPSAPPLSVRGAPQYRDEDDPVYRDPAMIPCRHAGGSNPTEISASSSPHVNPDLISNVNRTSTSPSVDSTRSDRSLVAAIDFGTTYSGYAFSFKHEYENDRLKISTNLWPHNNGLSMKAPTAILIGADFSVMSFGYEALKQYSDLAEYGAHKNCYFFRRFKMDLYGQRKVTNTMTLTDIAGKQMRAIDVFSKTIGFLKSHLLKRIRESDSKLTVTEETIHWVLTVPAIWNDKAKQFMRKAAEQAGIQGRHLTLALEPEAASLLCKYIPMYQESSQHQQEFKAFDRGSKYMVVDIGGGTVDVTVHTVSDKGAFSLEEIHAATGGYWGGTMVDLEFILLLNQVFGEAVISAVREKYPNDILDVFQEFESKKRLFEPDQTSSVSFKLPASLAEMYADVNEKTVSDGIQESVFHDDVRIKRDKILVSPRKFKQLFERSVSSIINHVNNLFLESRVTGIDTILLVGGYSESHVIKEAFISAFPHIRLIHPQNSSLAVLKGAVIFGHEPHAITSRVCKYTYGIGMLGSYDPAKHPVDKLQEVDGVLLCDDLFDTHLHIGKQVSLNKKRRGKQYRPPFNQKYAVLDVYASSAFDPTFVTEESCTHLGSVVIELSDCMPQNETITVSIMYGGTELQVEATESTSGKTTQAFFDFLG